MAPARAVALEALRGVRRGELADHAFERRAGSLSGADRRLAQELAYGVLRLRGRLDYLLDTLVKGGIRRLDPDVLDALRLGAYQLLELDRVPAYAAVSDSVEAAKAASGKGAASLTNAVLRRVDAGYAAFRFPDRTSDLAGYLSSWGSHPSWLVERWLDRMPAAEVEQLVEHDNRRPAMYLSAIGEREALRQRLLAAGVAAEPLELLPFSLRLESGGLAQALDTIPAIVQDPGAAAVVEYMALDPGTPVVDLCAAPGGKAALLAARGHEVLALDLVPQRLKRIVENRTRLQLSGLHLALADSTRPPVADAQVMLLDAPCTGTGTLARHPDGRWRLRVEDIEKLADLQRRLLDAAADRLAPGGLLVYATCSLEPEENEEQVRAFLNRHPAFELEAPDRRRIAHELLGPDGELRVLPQRDGVDGAYAVRLRRRSG